MIRKIRSPFVDHIRVIFELPAYIRAHQVNVVGDFNQWSKTATPLQQTRDGIWRASVDLPTGSRCEFRYLVDGQWMSDYHADALTINAYGSQNSLVIACLSVDDLLVARTSSQVWEFAHHHPTTKRFHSSG
ncbi:MAG: isoamylase early set domain-containing protein [Caldilineaceae bacterium]